MKSMEENLAKQKHIIKTLKNQSASQKNEIIKLSKQRDDAIREREHNFREKMRFESLHQQL